MALTDMKSEDFVDDQPYARAVAEALGFIRCQFPLKLRKNLLGWRNRLLTRRLISLICELAAGQGLKVLLWNGWG